MEITNPEGYNQYKPDPRQALFLSYYFDRKSPTFSNALQSALKAGYNQEYAESITAAMPNWLAESIRDAKIIKKAEKNLDEFLEKESDDPIDKKIKADMTKFALERLNKTKYSARQELTGENGEAIKYSNLTDEEVNKLILEEASKLKE